MEQAEAYGVRVVRSRVDILDARKRRLCRNSRCGRGYPAMGCDVRSGLAFALGAATTDVGCLKVDGHQGTSVDGLYAAGDVVSDLHQIAVATGHAAVAAARIHHCLPRNPR
jgi:thioredoxin reductase (NADPH)